nr:MAG TPA: hypothetical protein [Caudoviricetes sp.]
MTLTSLLSRLGCPLKEPPYMMVLEVTVDSVNELVTIERSRA